MVRRSIVAALLAAAAGTALPQEPPPQDSTASVVEFQRLLESYLSIKTRRGDQDQASWQAEVAPMLRDLIARFDELIPVLSELPTVLADAQLVKSLCHSRLATLLTNERRELDDTYNRLKARQPGAPTPDVGRDLARVARERADKAASIAAEYEKAREALRAALETGDRAITEGVRASDSAARFVRGIVFAQSAIVDDNALNAFEDVDEAGKAAGEPGYKPPREIRAESIRRLLDQAHELLSEYAASTPRESGIEWVRGQYVLGVVKYRAALKERPSERGRAYATELDPARRKLFDEARQIFAELSDWRKTEGVLGAEGRAQTSFQRSVFGARGMSPEQAARYYGANSELYLALSAAIDDRIERAERLRSALGHLDAAVRLDRLALEEGGAPTTREWVVDREQSLTEGVIVYNARQLRSKLEQAEKVAARLPLNDLTLSFGVGGLLDSNVPLLGRNTAPPVGKDRKRDFRVTSLLRLRYVVDLDSWFANDDFARRWQLLVEGRTSPTWNARIHDFNEQVYGATVNLRYSLYDQPSPDGKGLDAVYMHWRWDYDYFMLDNDGFLKSNRIRPALQFVAGGGLLDTSVFFNYEDRNYLEYLKDERFDRDGNYYSWGADWSVDLSRIPGLGASGAAIWKEANWGFLGPRETAGREAERPARVDVGVEFGTNSTQGEEFDYSNQILNAGVTVPLPYGANFTSAALFEWQDYRGNSLVDRNRRGRSDFIQEYRFGVERPFYLTDYDPERFQYVDPLNLARVVMNLYGQIRFTIDDSNVRNRLGESIFEYNRVIFSAGVRFDID